MTSKAEKIKKEIIQRYHQRTKISKRHHTNAKKFLPGGDTRYVCNFLPYPSYIEKGAGSRVYDVDGNEYLDFVNNYTSLIHGHSPPRIVEAVYSQLGKGTIYGAPVECQYRFAEHLTKRIPCMDYIRFSNSGNEATLFTMRAARCFTGKDVIIKMNGGYHGTHDYSWVNVLATDFTYRKTPRVLMEYGTPAGVREDTLVVEFNDLDSLETLLRKHRNRVAGIILAPIMTTNTIIFPEEGYLEGVRKLCDKYEVLLIFDEVVTFRLSKGGIQEITGVAPDLTALGKIIGGGFPIGAFGGKREIMERFSPEYSNNIVHSGTFNGNSIAMVAGLIAMKMYDKKEIERINKLGDRLRDGFTQAIMRTGLKAKAVNSGSLVSFLWKNVEIKNARDAVLAIKSTSELNKYIHLELLNQGLFIAPREFYSISTAMNKQEIDQAINIFKETLEYLKPLAAEANPELMES